MGRNRSASVSVRTMPRYTRFTVELPWPAPACFENKARGLHWAQKGEAVAVERQTAYLLTRQAMNLADYDADVECVYSVACVFFPPDRIRRDLQNCIHAMKAGIDGVAEAMGVDDYKFIEWSARWGHPGASKVVITIQETTNGTANN